MDLRALAFDAGELAKDRSVAGHSNPEDCPALAHPIPLSPHGRMKEEPQT